MEQQFLAIWCNERLEYVGNYTEYSQAKTWAALQGVPCEKTFPNIMHLMLRARYNSQRHYEIYIFTVEDGITTDDIEQMFEINPQSMADMIRANGHCIHSDRRSTERVKIV